MKYLALVVAPLLLVIACEKNSEPDCRDDQCAATANDGGGGPTPDGGTTTSNDDGATLDPSFDAGTIDPTQSCKGLFELCVGTECCAPYGCTNGACR